MTWPFTRWNVWSRPWRWRFPTGEKEREIERESGAPADEDMPQAPDY
jgi:hypothetical protein